MPIPKPKTKYVWSAQINNAAKTTYWFNHSTRRQIIKPRRLTATNMNQASINAFLNNVNLNTPHGVTWSVFISQG